MKSLGTSLTFTGTRLLSLAPRVLLTAMLLAPALLGPALLAQTHIVKKAQEVVRAVGVYEWTGDPAKPTASRMIPVTLFIEGKLEDAGVYLARPVPLALEAGTVFEAEKAGVPEGTLELASARHSQQNAEETGPARQSPAQSGPAQSSPTQFDDGWEGFGAFKAKPAERTMAEKPSGPLWKIVVSGGKAGPKFAAKAGDADPAKKPGASADATGGATTDTAEKDKEDRAVTLSRKNDPGAAEGDVPDDKADRPTLRKRTENQREAARKKSDTASVKAPATADDDPDRPTLHRGKPEGTVAEDAVGLRGIPADMQQLVVVSDAANRAEHDFARAWADDAERASVKSKLEAIARQKLAAYGIPTGPPVALAPRAAPAPATPTAATVKMDDTVSAPPVLRRGMPVESGVAKPGPAPLQSASKAPVQSAGAAAKRRTATARTHPATTGAAASFAPTDEDLRGYTLSYGGAPTFYFSATSPGHAGPDRYVTLVAQQEPTGELHLAMANVTDSAHLNRSPRLRLVDVVDAEASNRASMLMELRASASRQFALYRVIGAQAEQTFLNGFAQ